MQSNNRILAVMMTFVVAILIGFPHVNADETELEKKIQAALKQANPAYLGKGTFQFKDGKLIGINLMRCKGVTDLPPLSEFQLSSVSSVTLYNAANITDIGPLQKFRLQSLNLERCAKITDLSPLTEMPLA